MLQPGADGATEFLRRPVFMPGERGAIEDPAVIERILSHLGPPPDQGEWEGSSPSTRGLALVVAWWRTLWFVANDDLSGELGQPLLRVFRAYSTSHANLSFLLVQ
jgi:hypothetical protein